MTSAKIQTNPPDGSGLTHGLLDKLYEDVAAGRRVDAIPVVGLLVPYGHGERNTAKGKVRRVEMEFLRLEPVKDPHDAEQVAWQITRAYDLRHSPGQLEFSLSASPSEKRTSLLEDLTEWASENGVSEDELDQRFIEYFGGAEYSAAQHVRDASLVHLVEFHGYTVTTTDDETPAAPAPAFSDGDEDDQGEDTEP